MLAFAAGCNPGYVSHVVEEVSADNALFFPSLAVRLRGPERKRMRGYFADLAGLTGTGAVTAPAGSSTFDGTLSGHRLRLGREFARGKGIRAGFSLGITYVEAEVRYDYLNAYTTEPLRRHPGAGQAAEPLLFNNPGVSLEYRCTDRLLFRAEAFTTFAFIFHHRLDEVRIGVEYRPVPGLWLTAGWQAMMLELVYYDGDDFPGLAEAAVAHDDYMEVRGSGFVAGILMEF